MKNISTLEITKKLISFNTENQLEDTRNVSKFIGDLLAHNSIKYELIRSKNKVYLLSEIGRGNPKIVLYGHSDVVPAGDLRKWHTAPYRSVMKDGKLYGRGSSDMKGGLAAAISAFIELSRSQNELKGTVQLLVCPDEENYDGTKLLPKIIKKSKASACIMGEPHFDDIMIGEKGELEIKLKSHGKSSHGSTPAAGIDANIMLDKFIHELRDIILEFNRKIPQNKFNKESTIALSEQFNLKGDQRSDFISSNPAGTITMNVGYYKAGHYYNSVPDEAEAHMVIMVPYGFDYKKLVDFIEKNVKKHSNLITAEIISANNATLTKVNDPLIYAISKAYLSVKRKKPRIIFDSGPTDAVFYRKLKVPTILYGPGYFFNAHTYNEYVSVKELELCKEIYKKTVLNYLS